MNARADADRDQRKHIEMPAARSTPAAPEERPARPEHDRTCSARIAASAPRRAPSSSAHSARRCDIARTKTGSVSAALIQNRRVMSCQFGVFVVAVCRSDGLRLERHAALRALARLILLHLGMHRAGVDRLRRRRPSLVALQRHAAFRAIARHVGFNARAHRAEILRRCGWLYVRMVMRVFVSVAAAARMRSAFGFVCVSLHVQAWP